MLDGLLLIVLAALANAQLLDTWLQGSIFKRQRDFIEPLQESRFVPIRLWGELVLCNRCLAHWIAIPVMYAVYHTWPVWPTHPCALALIWLAVVRLSCLFYREDPEEEGLSLDDIPAYGTGRPGSEYVEGGTAEDEGGIEEVRR